MKQIYQQVAENLNVEEENVKLVIEYVFAWVRKELTELNHSKVLVNYLGTFSLLEGKLKKVLASGRLSKEDEEKTIIILNKFKEDTTNED